jgi:glycosyltransferase involved in cell wall biosynthesis
VKSIAFVYFTNNKDSLGIELKIRNLNQSFKTKGFLSETYPVNASKGFTKSTFELFKALQLNSKYFFIRYNNSRNFFLFILIILLKLKGKKVILEIPTPIINYCKEIILSNSSRFRKSFILVSTYLLGPIPFFFPDLIIQYAEEGYYFKLLTRKNLLLGNGIDVESYILKNSQSNRFKNFKVYNIVVIANLAPWHGIDLLLKALSLLKFKFHLHIIGDGPEKNKLELLATNLNLQDSITFHGKLSREKYLLILEKAHLGIGSLNWNIIDVKISSALKLREYVSAGLPVIFSSFDPDLSGETNCIEVKCDVQSILEALIISHNRSSEFLPEEQYALAKNKLDMLIKVDNIIATLST